MSEPKLPVEIDGAIIFTGPTFTVDPTGYGFPCKITNNRFIVRGCRFTRLVEWMLNIIDRTAPRAVNAYLFKTDKASAINLGGMVIACTEAHVEKERWKIPDDWT